MATTPNNATTPARWITGEIMKYVRPSDIPNLFATDLEWYITNIATDLIDRNPQYEEFFATPIFSIYYDEAKFGGPPEYSTILADANWTSYIPANSDRDRACAYALGDFLDGQISSSMSRSDAERNKSLWQIFAHAMAEEFRLHDLYEGRLSS